MSKLGNNILLEKMDSSEGIAALFEYATEGIMVTNSNGEIIKINPAAEKMFGYPKDELIGQKVESLIPTRFTHRHEKMRDGFMKSPHPRSMGFGLDLLGKRKDGSEFPVEISLSPYKTENKNYIIAFIIDITQRKLIEEKIKNYSAELEKQVEKRTMILREAIEELEKTKVELNHALEKEKELGELKTRFVSMASHEFRTPLATILSSLSLVDKYGDLGEKEKQQKHIARIKSSINALTDILNDILSISKLEEGKIAVSFEEINFIEHVKGVIQELQTLVKQGQKIIYDHKGLDKVIMDKKILRHVLFNLISNAIKFSEQGKSISVNTEIDDEQITIKIADEGIGISEEDQKHLFERFFRAHNATNIQGTGLGLNIVGKYVEMLEGSIEFESVLEKGTTFTIKIPNNKEV